MTRAASSRSVREIRSDDTRERLLDSALRCFAAKGFRATTTRDITEGAGLSPAALYVHFKSKQDVLYQISVIGHTRILDRLRRAVAGPGAPAEHLDALVRTFVRWHTENHTRARVNNLELPALSDPHAAEIASIRRQIQAEWDQVIDAGLASGDFHTPDPRMTATAIVSLGIDIARWYRDGGVWSPDGIAEHYGQLALRMLGVQPNPAH